MTKTRCPMCGHWLTVDDSPAPPDGIAFDSDAKVVALQSYLDAASEALKDGGLLVAVHATITAAGMLQAEMPELAYHDCYPDDAPDAFVVEQVNP